MLVLVLGLVLVLVLVLVLGLVRLCRHLLPPQAVAGCSRLKPWDIHPARRGIILPLPRVGLRGSAARLLHLRARPLRGRGAGVLKSPLCFPRCLH